MRIGLLVGVVTHPLAGEDGVDERVHSSADGFEMAPEIAKQPMAYFRGSFARQKDRGNLLNVITFSTTRLFATHAEASLFAQAYDGMATREGILVIDNLGTDGAVESRVHMLNSLVDPPRRRLTGCTLFLDYTVTGGEIQQVSGDPPTFWEDFTAPNWEDL